MNAGDFCRFGRALLIRVYRRGLGILATRGLLEPISLWLGVIDAPLTIMNTTTAVYIGMFTLSANL